MATSYDSKEFCQKYKLPTLIDMENLAPQSNENSKFLSLIDGQETFDFDKHLDDNGKQLITFIFILIKMILVMSYTHFSVFYLKMAKQNNNKEKLQCNN